MEDNPKKTEELKKRIDKGDQWLYEHQAEKKTDFYKKQWKFYLSLVKEYEKLTNVKIKN